MDEEIDSNYVCEARGYQSLNSSIAFILSKITWCK